MIFCLFLIVLTENVIANALKVKNTHGGFHGYAHIIQSLLLQTRTLKIGPNSIMTLIGFYLKITYMHINHNINTAIMINCEYFNIHRFLFTNL